MLTRVKRQILLAPPLWVPRGSGALATLYGDYANQLYWFNRRFPDFASWLSALGGTFSRASTASYTNSAGLLATAASVALRFDYDPVTLLPRGILLEGARTNLALQSNAFTNASWGTVNATKAAAAVLAPDGTTNVFTLSDSATNARHTTFQSITVINGTTYAATFVLKQNTLRYQQVLISDGSKYYGVIFDLQSGVVTNTTSSGSPAGTSNSINSIGNGWYACIVTMTVASTTAFPQTASSNSATPAYDGNGNPSYSGSGQSNYVFSGQLEAGSFASSYIPTTSGSVTRAADALALTLPANVSTITYTFDNNSTQSASVSPGAFTVPTNLNRPDIKSLAVFR